MRRRRRATGTLTVLLMLTCSVCRMEETVRSLLQNQGVLDQTAVSTVDIVKAYKVNRHHPLLLLL